MEKSLSTILTRSYPQQFPILKTLFPIVFFRSHCLTHRTQPNPQLHGGMLLPLLLAVRHVSFPAVGILRFCSYEMPLILRETNFIGSCSPKKSNFRSRLRFVAAAQFFDSFSVDINFDSKTTRSHDSSPLSWVGPVPGDIAEVEAYCRIFRAAEQVHASLMRHLCNPLSGECSVPYDFTLEEKPLFEDKVVSVLGCMVSLLNKGKDDVLSGRPSSMNTPFNVAVVMDDQLPPLAIFRSEMKKCCESLHVALEYYLTTSDDRSHDLWMKLQRLKNVCYDSGFPRGFDCPCHTLFSNWNSIYISSTSKSGINESTDSKLAFQSGGHVTEEGLKWLLRHGYKTIVDLRAESVRDIFYERAIEDAILSGKIDLVRIPVEKRNVPSMEQVEKFASLVSDSTKMPIYLHSKEGVWRTSSMVSRWRQYMSHYNRTATSNNIFSENINEMRNVDKVAPLQDDKNSVPQSFGISGDSYNDVSLSTSVKIQRNEPCNSTDASENKPPITETEVGTNLWVDIDPLKAQLPPCNFFSKKEMSRFFTSKKMSPPGYFYHPWKGIQMGQIVGNDRELNHINKDSSNESICVKNVSEKFQPPFGPVVSESDVGSLYPSSTKSVVFNGVNKSDIASTCNEMDQKNRVEYSGIDDLSVAEGNMCASATGVVRVQSRKKAEMFLVRTDGFSCTREKVTESSLAFSHPTTQQQMLMWKSTPRTVLLLKKMGAELIEETKEIASFLYYEENMDILVEPDVHDIFARIPGFGFVQTFYVQDTSYLHERVDFVACLGGDGVILHASNIFRGAVPPVLSFNLGSLGFLTTHAFEDHKHDLREVIHGNNTLDGVYITLRMRLRCEMFRNGKSIPGKIFDVLNEVVVDRGSNPYLSKIECYERDLLITKVQGDGVIVATPTGSTAYSTSAGGSMVHPNVPCILFTPICPHSLSFRPVILPDSAKLELKIPEEARSNAWVSFDGKRRQQLSRGDSVRISMSRHPIPTVNKFDQTGDWFHSLIRCLNWNERQDQKAL